MKEQEKEMIYTYLVYRQIIEMLRDEECSNYVDIAELQDTKNMTAFIHALSSAACQVYNKLTGNEVNFLEFNHIANQLCFQFAKLEDKAEEKS